jgi:hypothetical protein
VNDNISSEGRHRRWKKGQSGNPGGRPKSRLVSEALRTQLAALKPGDPKGRTYAELIASNLIEIASESDGSEAVHAAGLIADRIEGRVKQQVEVTGLAAEISAKSDSELLFHLDHGRWPTHRNWRS